MNLQIIVVIFSLIVSLFHSMNRVSNYNSIRPTPIPTFSCNYDLRLPDAMKKLQNQTAVDMLKKNCEWLMDNFTANFDGSNDLVFLTAGAGCGSCRGQTLHILSRNKVIYEKILDDPKLTTRTVDGQTALVIRQPIRKHNETYGDPGEWDEVTYVWSGGTFVHYDEQTGFYISPTP